jgi:hypothetical protein
MSGTDDDDGGGWLDGRPPGIEWGRCTIKQIFRVQWILLSFVEPTYFPVNFGILFSLKAAKASSLSAVRTTFS